MISKCFKVVGHFFDGNNASVLLANQHWIDMVNRIPIGLIGYLKWWMAARRGATNIVAERTPVSAEAVCRQSWQTVTDGPGLPQRAQTGGGIGLTCDRQAAQKREPNRLQAAQRGGNSRSSAPCASDARWLRIPALNEERDMADRQTVNGSPKLLTGDQAQSPIP